MAKVPIVRTRKLGMVREALTGLAVSGVLFVVCWLAARAGSLNATHAFISLFTPQPVDSTAALADGGLWALVFGAATVALVAFFHNLFAPRS